MTPAGSSDSASVPDAAPESAGGAPSERRRTTRWFLMAVALQGLVFLLALAPWMGEDEPWHLEYASHVADGYRPWGGVPLRADPVDPRTHLPFSQLQVRRRFHEIPDERLKTTQAEILDSMAAHHFYERVDWAGVEPRRSNFDQVAPDFSAATQPPFYYLVVGNLLKVLPVDTIEGRLWAARLFSWVMFVATALVTLAFARSVLDDEPLAVAAAALACFLPMSARQAAVVNNDVLARFLVVVVLWLAARWVLGRARPWELAVAVAACGLGLLTKSTTASAVAVLLVALFARSERFSARGLRIGAVLGVVLVTGAGLAVWILQNSPVVPRSMKGLILRIETGFAPDNLAMIVRTMLGSFGWESRFLPGWIEVALALLALVGLVSFVRVLLRGESSPARRVLVLCLVALLVQLAMVVLRGTSKGRYLMPVMPAIAVMLVSGWAALWPAQRRQRAPAAIVTGLVAFFAFFLWGGLVVHEFLLWSV